ncbi:MAG: hypothetical protein COA67_07935 [Lutibacter sp.]|nr:MAG: hypothetical protein COA67_07935 [Lutibacter sp.]
MNLSQSQNKQWNTISKITFRFVFIYFILFIVLLFSSFLLEVPLRWFAQNILNWGADFEMLSTGSGDRSYDYVRFGLNVILALLIGTVWAIIHRKKTLSKKLIYWFQTILRIFLFLAMTLYGLVKIFKGQFPDPSLELLIQPVGEMSPMGLAWTFMGHSIAYNIFIGFAEVLGGALLLYRKTVTLGSMIIIGVMTNVAMMNFTYDIPVKLFSIHLILMALVLLIADGRRVMNVFLKNKSTKKEIHYTPSINTTLKKLISVLKVFVLTLLTVAIIIQCFVRFKATDQLKSKSELYGIWESQLFIKNKDTLPPLLTDSYRWRYLIVNYKKKAAIKKMNDSIDRYQFEINKEQKEVIFKRSTDSISHRFSYKLINPEHLQLRGVLDKDSLSIEFKRKLETDFRLLKRKFHWVNESIYNY